MFKGVPLIPTFVRTGGPPVQFTAQPLHRAHNATSREVLTEALVSENESRIAAGALPILTEEKSSEKASDAGFCAFLESIQHSADSACLAVFLNFADGRGAAVAMPRCQTDFF